MLTSSDHLRDRRSDRLRLTDRRQLTHPHPVLEAETAFRRARQRELGLADPAHTDNRHHVSAVETTEHRRDVTVAAHQRHQSLRQVADCRLLDAQLQERRAVTRVDDFEHVDQFIEVLQRMLTQRNQVDVTQRNIDQHVTCRSRYHDLATMRCRHQPCRTVHCRTEIVAVALIGLTSVQTDSHPQHHPRRPRRIIHCPPQRNPRLDRIGRPTERRRERIPRRREHIARVALDRLAQEPIMQHHRFAHLSTPLRPQPRGALDICEQKRHRPRWNVAPRHDTTVTTCAAPTFAKSFGPVHTVTHDEHPTITSQTRRSPGRIAPHQGLRGGHDGTRTRDLYRVMVSTITRQIPYHEA